MIMFIRLPVLISSPPRVYNLEFMDEVVHVEAHDSDVLCIEYSPFFESETTTLMVYIAMGVRGYIMCTHTWGLGGT